MNQTYRILAVLGFATILAGRPKGVYAQFSPSRSLVAAQQEKQTSAVELYNRGVDKLNAGNYQGAIADFNQALQIDPNDADTYYNRGYAQHTLGRYDQALADYTQAIQLNPTFAEAFYNRGLSRFNLKNYKEAIDDLNQAVALFKQNGRTENAQSAMDVIKTIQDLGKS